MRSTTMRALTLAVLAGALALAMAACDAEDPAELDEADPDPEEAEEPDEPAEEPEDEQDVETDPEPGGQLEVARSADVDNLDPHLATAFQSRQALELIYETLTEFDEDLNVVEGLAEDWEYTDDTTLVLHLREGVTFHDGSDLTADDVVATIERLIDPDSGAVAGINFGSVEEVEAVDERTVELGLSTPDQTLPAAFADANAAITPAEAIEEETFDDDPNGSGPFEFDEWDPGSVFRLEANEDYWRDGPFVDTVNIRVVPEQSSIAAGLQAGEYDVGVLEDPSTVLTIPEEQFTVHRADALAYRALMMNQEREPFGDPQVREAITCAIDREDLVEAAALGEGRVTGPFTAPEWQFDPYGGLDCDPPDPDYAADLLAEAGYEDGFEASAIINSDGYATAVDEGQVLQAQFSEVGIDLDLEVLESGVYVDRWIEADFDVAVALNGGRPDPHNMYARYFSLDGDLNDVATHESEEVDALIEEGLAEEDLEARQEIYEEMSERLISEAPWAWLYTGFEYRITQPEVEGFVPYSDGSMRSLREVTLEQ